MATPVEAEIVDERESPKGQLVQAPDPLAVVPRDAQAVAVAAAAMQEVRTGMELARAYPRNEDECRGKVIKQCQRKNFAMKAEYDFRHGRRIQGPTIDLLEMLARVWGNIHYGHRVLIDTEVDRTIECYAHDLETGTKPVQQVTFKKMQQRKDEDGKTRWVAITDEKELRWKTNSEASTAIRNCLERIIPRDLIEDALDECRKTKLKEAKDDPDAFRRNLIDGFVKLVPSISGQELTDYLGHPIAQLGPEALVAMRGLYQALKDRELTWAQACAQKAVSEGLLPSDSKALSRTGADLARLRQAKAQGAQQPQAAPKKQWTEDAQKEGKKPAKKGQPPAAPPSDTAAGDSALFDKDVDRGKKETREPGQEG